MYAVHTKKDQKLKPAETLSLVSIPTTESFFTSKQTLDPLKETNKKKKTDTKMGEKKREEKAMEPEQLSASGVWGSGLFRRPDSSVAGLGA